MMMWFSGAVGTILAGIVLSAPAPAPARPSSDAPAASRMVQDVQVPKALFYASLDASGYWLCDRELKRNQARRFDRLYGDRVIRLAGAITTREGSGWSNDAILTPCRRYADKRSARSDGDAAMQRFESVLSSMEDRYGLSVAATGMASSPVPHGATINPSGYATILSAPPTGPITAPPVAPPPPPADGRPTPLPMTSEARAARERMMNPDDATREAAQALDRRIGRAERGNYVGMRIVRDPGPRFAFQFRRDAAATLARYTRDARFTSREGGLTRAELQPVFDEWWKRFEPFRLVGGGSVYEFDGVVRFDMNIDEAGFREIAARERWTLPERLTLRFSPPRNPRSIDPALARYVRVFARADRHPAIINQALLSGRVVLRDGCFRVTGREEGGEPLVIFGRDVELGLDAQGYMVLKHPDSGRAAPRIGERMMWAGPLGYSEADPNVKTLRARCGAGPIVAMGVPDTAFRSE
jgi:hypothetical protein